MASPISRALEVSARGSRLLAASAGLLSLVAPGLRAQRETPHVIERQARRAIEGGRPDSARGIWTARIRTDASDRAARLGLATLSDLGYDYPDAAARYRMLSDTVVSRLDHYAAY